MTQFNGGSDTGLPRWGRVEPAKGPVPWLVVDDAREPVLPVQQFLSDFVVRNRPLSVRSYAFALLRWWRWLVVLNRPWDRVTPDDARDFVLLLNRATKPRRHPRTMSSATAGTVNPITRKPYLDDSYTPATVRHGNAVIRSFYEYWIDRGEGPLINPFQPVTGRRNTHHDPLTRFVGDPLRYNPKVARKHPRSLSDEQWNDVFAALGSHRDRALLSMAVSTGARASELLGLRQPDINWGDQLVRVVRKGSRAEQWLPTSSESLVWLRLYLNEPQPTAAIWVTLRRRDNGSGPAHQPLNYEALRAVFRRINTRLHTNWSMHDLRHTAALRMSRDPSLTLRDVQTILGHRNLETTAQTYLYEDEVAVARRVLHHLTHRRDQEATPSVAESGYAAEDLKILFGREVR